jgi:hypothetical protein
MSEAICGTATDPHIASHMRATTKYNSAFSRRHSPEFCKFIRPKKKRAQAPLKKRAQGRPGARCTRGLACKGRQKNAHEHTGSAEAVRPSLRNGFTAYIVLSPARPGLLVTVTARIPPRNLTPAIGASGPHDFAVRLRRARQSQLSRPPLPDPRFVTNAHTPLWWDGMAIEVKLICLRDQARPLRHISTTGKSVKCVSSDYLMARCVFS